MLTTSRWSFAESWVISPWYNTNFDSLYMVDDVTSLKVLRMSYGGFRRNDNFGPKPVETGKEYEVQISEISRKGDGIARIQGFVIFVKNGKVGQNAKIRVVQVGNRFATAEIVDEVSSTTSTTPSTAAQSSSEQVTS